MQRKIALALAGLVVVLGAAIVGLGATQASAEGCTLVQCPPTPEGPCGISGTLCTTPPKVPPQTPRYRR